ncbi:MAG: hypothetical protein CBE14_001495 [Rickettsiales bacterium TMED254]|nr:hypothetical protein [Rickettsiales bacterium]RPF77067.1 MAG: hypothetical protein CBE14_001495 [Rickettsiales bacterium TMED254]
MDYLVSLFVEKPAEMFANLFLALTILTIFLVGLSFYYDYLKKKESSKKIESFDRSLKDLVEELRTFELLLSNQKQMLDEHKYILNRMEQEISRLADSLNNDENITSAISLAKEGLSVSEISKKTGIPSEEIEPIVKYHGPR